MKKLMLLLAAICFVFPMRIQTASADGNNANFNPMQAMQVKQQVEQLADQLYLVGTQREQFLEIFKQQYIKFQMPPSSITDEAQSSLKSLLTDEQFSQFNTLIQSP
jgi:Spy/CpxP family protein refolding chaperone